MNAPLVSIVVITYNSAEFVEETLASIHNQSHGNIELIISDDSSTDNTLEICKKWLKANWHRQNAYKIIETAINTGIPANCNRGIQSSSGDWIKLIAGDDLLVHNCIEELLEDTEHKNIITGKCQHFYKDGDSLILKEITPQENNFFEFNANQQFKFLLYNAFNFAPGAIFRRDVFKKYGLYSERYKFIEDLPYWLHVTNHGEKIFLKDSVVVYYRIGHESASMTKKNIYNKNFYNSFFQLKREMIYPHVPWYHISYFQSEIWDFLLFKITVNFFSNKKSSLTDAIQYIFTVSKLKVINNKIRKLF